MNRVQLFLSTVSAEFGSYRDALKRPLTRANVTVAVQEDFVASGTETLDKLDDYVKACDAVIHLVGDMTGALAKPSAVASLQTRYPDLGERLSPLAPFLVPGAPLLSYTQWEAYLAIYHRRELIIAKPDANAPRDAGYVLNSQQQEAQQEHLQRLRAMGQHVVITFANPEKLIIEVQHSTVLDILAKAGPAAKPINLPFASLESLFKGREPVLLQVRDSLQAGSGAKADAIALRALHGLGGVGKTRLAVEYAWRYAEHYNALLFVTADAPQALQRNLAALCGEPILNLPEREAPEEAARVAAALRWLNAHPGWLLILDNIDTAEAGDAAEKLLAGLHGGHVLLTGRLSSWSAGVHAIELDTLAPGDARDFLLERTAARRRKAADDATQAQTLAVTLGRLALALEQAGAYIAQRRLTFAAYLAEWQDHRERVLTWFDERLMQYHSSVAITWQTSVDQLSAPALRLLQRLAWLAPEPIPETLLDVAVPGAADDGDARDALAELETYSLVTRAADQPTFSVHRLVQEVTRLGLKIDPHNQTLAEALRWVDVAFAGNPDDVRSWPVLVPLAPHARAVTRHADEAGIAEPTSRLMNQLGLLLNTNALHAEAEPLFRRALKMHEVSYGPDHPDVSTNLNNLAVLLESTNRLAEAEPLYRRALKINEASYGPDHPVVATNLNNLAHLLESTNRLAEAEPLYRRALQIDEASYGPDHPDVARDLNNLAFLLGSTNRLAEAEPLYRRALKINEASYGPEHPNVATALNGLAELLRSTNRLAEAEPLYRRALQIDESSYGPDHPDVARDLNNLAFLLGSTNRLAEAEPLYRRALQIDEASYGPDHPEVARAMNNLASLLESTNRLAEAEPLYRQGLKILLNFNRSTGHEHPQLHTVVENYVNCLKRLGKSEAEIQAILESLRQA